jgi:ADP-ribosylglycohydrolase
MSSHGVPDDYLERIYAGVLGKIIGVYLGRPFEGWTHEQIVERLGEVSYYVHHRRDVPLNNHLLVVTDDDIAGTFTFVRALPDHGSSRDLTPAQIGETWLNYIVERRTTLWWGGLGNSTEHTAYLRLKSGIAAPHSGSSALNGPIVSQQIGAQIFIDGWAMVAPGNPELAADLARRAASVSHDGEAVYAAQLLAAMEAQAFVEPDINRLLDIGLALIPRDCVIHRLFSDLREWRAADLEWRGARQRIEEHYGYDRYPGNCHVVPNHALIHLGLLYGGDDFQRALMITNTAGWDTDCNSGNVGCLLGIKNGLAGLDAGPDWRGPVADRLYVSSAEGGRAISDAVIESYHLADCGHRLVGREPLPAPKGGARFHFSLPGSVQGFRSSAPPLLRLENAAPRGLALHFNGKAHPGTVRAGTPTFIPPGDYPMPGYGLSACPTLYPGQIVRASLRASQANRAPVVAGLYIGCYGAGDALEYVVGPGSPIAPGECREVTWHLSHPASTPVAEVGVQLSSQLQHNGTVYLDWLGWDGEPDVVFSHPAHTGQMWRQAWVNALDHFGDGFPESFRLSHNDGRGLLIQGTREWRDYEASAQITAFMATGWGLAVRVQGLRRYYALVLSAGGSVKLVRAVDGETTLAEAGFALEWGKAYDLALRITGQRLQARLDGHALFDVEDDDRRLAGGAVALLCQSGCIGTDAVTVSPAAEL